MAGVYIAFLLFGFVPVNLDYKPPPSKGAVQIFIRSNEIHTDLVLPVRHDETGIDWREVFPPEHFPANVGRDEFVAIGWGNRRFFVETPRWADFKISAALGALFWPSESVLHVEYMTTATPGSTLHAVQVSPEQYRELADFVESTVACGGAPGGSPNSLSGKNPATLATTVSYHSRDRFYDSTGRYHLFNTCNQWTGRGLNAQESPPDFGRRSIRRSSPGSLPNRPHRRVNEKSDLSRPKAAIICLVCEPHPRSLRPGRC